MKSILRKKSTEKKNIAVRFLDETLDSSELLQVSYSPSEKKQRTSNVLQVIQSAKNRIINHLGSSSQNTTPVKIKAEVIRYISPPSKKYLASQYNISMNNERRLKIPTRFAEESIFFDKLQMQAPKIYEYHESRHINSPSSVRKFSQALSRNHISTPKY